MAPTGGLTATATCAAVVGWSGAAACNQHATAPDQHHATQEVGVTQAARQYTGTHPQSTRFFVQGRAIGHAWRTLAYAPTYEAAQEPLRRAVEARGYGAWRCWESVRLSENGRVLLQYRLGRLVLPHAGDTATGGRA